MRGQQMQGMIGVVALAAGLGLAITGAARAHEQCDEHTSPQPILSVADVNGDGVVNGRDVAEVARRNPSRHGDPRYHPLYDLNADGVINHLDVRKANRDIRKPVPLVDTQLAQTALATMRYYGPDGLANAIADGYIPFTPEQRGHGIHYARADILALDFTDFEAILTKLLDPFDHTQPIGLNFSRDGELLAVFYAAAVPPRLLTVPEFHPSDLLANPGLLLPDQRFDLPPEPSFDGLTDHEWHFHQLVWWTGLGSLNPEHVIIEENVPLEVIITRLLPLINFETGEIFVFPFGDQFYAPKFWMLHAWVHTLNPCGVFGEENPLVSADLEDEHGGH